MERVWNPETPGFYSWLFLEGRLCPVIDLSLLNQYINKQHFRMETVKSVGESIMANNYRSDRCISSCSNTSDIQKIPSVRLRALGELALVAQLAAPSYWRPGGHWFNPAEVGNILSWRLSMKYFLQSFSPFR